MTNLITGTQKSAENKENDNVDRYILSIWAINMSYVFYQAACHGIWLCKVLHKVPNIGCICRSHSPEAHPLPDERAGSIYVQAQWQDGGVIHDVKPHGQGISLSRSERAARQGEKDMASA